MTKNASRFKNYFSRCEKILWSTTTAGILLAFFIFDGKDPLTLTASLVGATALIFNAKGNPFGQVLMVAFSIIYGIISFSFAYYGEMITYLGMTLPMAVVSLVSWLRHPFDGDRAAVKIERLKKQDALRTAWLTVAVTLPFAFILALLKTANLIPSTISVATSFIAAYLTYHRVPEFALAYAANDVVLIILWCLASAEDKKYVSITVCFVAFLINDLYGYMNWRKMQKKQSDSTSAK